ncbi:MAG TPA: beta-propeller fold lactonase family protein [Gaiellaceae bacterium]|nr:beta-propeller fold lactonase family protein [Gaiellaceae bacterium]
MEAVYVQTNDAEKNEVVAFRRESDGSLSKVGSFETGGTGTGKPHLPSQSSVVLSGDGAWLLVANGGSDTISLFEAEHDGLRLADVVGSGGGTPTSVAVHESLVYVANNANASVVGFTITSGKLIVLEGSTRMLSADGADPAQICFSPDGKTLVVTERGANSISAFAIDERGYADGPSTIASAGETPYGFDFTSGGTLVVTEAFGGAKGKAAASSYTISAPGRLSPVSASVADTRSEVCWAAVTKDGRFAYVTNFGDCTISSYSIAADGTIELAEAVAGSTRFGQSGVRDEAITNDGRYLYALDADAQRVHGWRIDADGRLSEIGAADGLPSTVAGLAAS